jgi:hypothetical protein
MSAAGAGANHACSTAKCSCPSRGWTRMPLTSAVAGAASSTWPATASPSTSCAVARISHATPCSLLPLPLLLLSSRGLCSTTTATGAGQSRTRLAATLPNTASRSPPRLADAITTAAAESLRARSHSAALMLAFASAGGPCSTSKEPCTCVVCYGPQREWVARRQLVGVVTGGQRVPHCDASRASRCLWLLDVPRRQSSMAWASVSPATHTPMLASPHQPPAQHTHPCIREALHELCRQAARLCLCHGLGSKQGGVDARHVQQAGALHRHEAAGRHHRDAVHQLERVACVCWSMVGV